MRLDLNVKIRLAGRGHLVSLGHTADVGLNSEFQGAVVSPFDRNLTHSADWPHGIIIIPTYVSEVDMRHRRANPLASCIGNVPLRQNAIK
jgi:hypothetical protein